MTFAATLNRLREAARNSPQGFPPPKTVVEIGDLRELLQHFDRLDKEARARRPEEGGA